MGLFLDKPLTTKHTIKGDGNGLRYGASSMQGWRPEMEDAHSAVIGLPGMKNWSFFGVYDGHAGEKVSLYSSQALLNNIIKTEEFKKICRTSGEYEIDSIVKGIRTGFLQCDAEMRNLNSVSKGEDESGSTATTVMISNEHIIFANCGDSRSLLSCGGQVKFVTADHKPTNPGEKSRIEKAGGEVVSDRVNGDLAMSRALGDFEYKKVKDKGPCEQLVSPEPDVTVIRRTPEDEFVVLACDGVWDVMSNEDLCAIVRDRMTVTDVLEDISSQIIDACLRKESKDNMSLIIVSLEGAPKVNVVAKKRDEQLDVMLESTIKDILEKTPPPHELMSVIHQLADQNIDNLPPGGIITKSSKIEEYFNLHKAPEENMSEASPT